MIESSLHLFVKFVYPTAPLQNYFKIDACGECAFNGNFLCGVETVA